MNLEDLKIDKSWTLFLDRDGVINKKLDNDYVRHWSDFEFIDEALQAIQIFNKIFGTIIVVTNQQGIGKRLYRTEDLELIHRNMLYEINFYGGRIDKVYFAPQLAEEGHPDRKPGTGMALKARNDFPEIDFNKSIMVGDSTSDILFGKNAGMKTVHISTHRRDEIEPDFTFSSLIEFALALLL